MQARICNISASGMFIESEDVLWVGAGFRARVSAEYPLFVECSVKRVEPGYGMGITYEVHEDQSQRHVHALLAKLAASA